LSRIRLRSGVDDEITGCKVMRRQNCTRFDHLVVIISSTSSLAVNLLMALTCLSGHPLLSSLQL
jgi:hypothetical protein